MERNPTEHLHNEKDLQFYEEFLREAKQTPNFACNIDNKEYKKGPEKKQVSASMHSFLQDHIGKTVRVEFVVGNTKEIKVGKLFKVGEEYIVLKPHQSNRTILCDISSIKFITITHNF